MVSFPLVAGTLALGSQFSACALNHLDGDVDGNEANETEHEHRGHTVQDAGHGRNEGLDELQNDGHHTTDNTGAEGDTDAVTLDVLRGDSANLSTASSANQHDKGGHEFSTALKGVGSSAVQAGNHNFKEVSANGHVGRTANHVNEGGHADKTATDTEDTSQHTSQEAHEHRQPRGAVNAGFLEVHHGRNLDGMQALGPVDAHGVLSESFTTGSGFTFLTATHGHIMEHHPCDEEQQGHVHPAHNLFNVAEAFQIHNALGASFETNHGADQHDQAELVVNVPELAMTHGGNQRFTSHMRNVSTNGERHGETKNIQTGGHHPSAAHTEEATNNTNANTQNNQ